MLFHEHTTIFIESYALVFEHRALDVFAPKGKTSCHSTVLEYDTMARNGIWIDSGLGIRAKGISNVARRPRRADQSCNLTIGRHLSTRNTTHHIEYSVGKFSQNDHPVPQMCVGNFKIPPCLPQWRQPLSPRELPRQSVVDSRHMLFSSSSVSHQVSRLSLAGARDSHRSLPK